MAKKTIEIETDLIAFVEKQAIINKRSFTQQLNLIVENEKNRTENKERKDNE